MATSEISDLYSKLKAGNGFGFDKLYKNGMNI